LNTGHHTRVRDGRSADCIEKTIENHHSKFRGIASVKTQIVGGSVVLPRGVMKADIEIAEGIISAIGNLRHDPHAVRISARGKYVLPGFIDIHANGIAGFDLTNGVFDVRTGKFNAARAVYQHGLGQALDVFAQTGTTLVTLAILEAPVKKLEKVLEHIADFKRKADPVQGALLHGIYLEGVFLKEGAYAGAHTPKYFHTPSIGLFTQLQHAAGNCVRIVNVVPEWGTPASRLIKYLVTQGIVCATGHSGATGDDYRKAIDWGSTLAVHLLNGPSSSSFKPFHGGGVVEVALNSDQVFAEIIADGYHVDRPFVLDIIKRKGIDRSVLVTDCMFATKMKSIRSFRLGGMLGEVSSNRKYLTISGRKNALFGSVLTMDQAFENMVNWLTTSQPGVWNRLHEACSLDDAVWKASRMCSTTPARVLGVYETSNRFTGSVLASGTGEIRVGKRADVILASIQRFRAGVQCSIEGVVVEGYVLPQFSA
jgi:N-acetylglucosamine-6-phosphate deacetylase